MPRRCALEEANISVSVYRVCDGEQALAFLRKVGQYDIARTPDLVLLDLNTPRLDGWTVLREMQQSLFFEHHSRGRAHDVLFSEGQTAG